MGDTGARPGGGRATSDAPSPARGGGSTARRPTDGDHAAVDRRAEALAALRRAVLGTPGATDPLVREAAFARAVVPEPWATWVDGVWEESWRIGEADVAALLAAGCSEDAVLEVTLAAALGAATRRLDAGMRALRDGAAG